MIPTGEGRRGHGDSHLLAVRILPSLALPIRIAIIGCWTFNLFYILAYTCARSAVVTSRCICVWFCFLTTQLLSRLLIVAPYHTH